MTEYRSFLVVVTLFLYFFCICIFVGLFLWPFHVELGLMVSLWYRSNVLVLLRKLLKYTEIEIVIKYPSQYPNAPKYTLLRTRVIAGIHLLKFVNETLKLFQ